MRAVIMAGGEGTRLRPLTCNLPKPMVPILNAPMMEHIVNLLKVHNFTKIACTLWYLPQAVEDHFQDGSPFGVQLDYFVEREPLGTAGSVKNAIGNNQEPILVISGDALTDINLSAAVDFHRQKGAAATLVLSQVPNPLSYGVVLTDPGGRITQFLEKPSWDQVFSDFVNTGIYILEPEVMALIPSGQKYDFSRDLFPKILEMGLPLYGFGAQGYWNDIGSLNVYREAMVNCLTGEVKLNLPNPRAHHIYLEEDVQIHSTAQILGPTYLSRGTRIGAGCTIGPHSVLGPNCQVAKGTSIKHSILWSGVKVGQDCELRGAICAKNTLLQSHTKLYEGSVLGEKVQVGMQTTIKPDVKVWPGKIIPSGSKLKQSLVWGSQSRPSLFSKDGIKGDYRGDLTPEILIQIGLAYADFIGQGEKVLVTADFSKLGELVKKALIVGLRSGGIHVYDGGRAEAHLTGFGVQKLKLKGALHCGASFGDNGVLIQCWDAKGRLVGKNDQRKLENILIREDYPRPGQNELGQMHSVPSVRDDYLKTLANIYPAQVQGFAVGLTSPNEAPLSRLIKDYLNLAGYEVVEDKFQGLPTIVVQDESWFIQDGEGLPFSEDVWWHIFVKLLAKQGQKEVAVPVNRSQQIEKTAQRHGLNIRWTKMEPAFWMEVASELGNTVKHDDIELYPHVQPLVSVGAFLHYISSTAPPLPQWRIETQGKSLEIPCPWEKKGKIMRKLIDDSNPEQTIYLDGIKTYGEQGWVLVVPDGDEPVFRLYSEADTEENAEKLLEHYVNLINSYENEER